jgi:putative ABC transport system substrate-binding protein
VVIDRAVTDAGTTPAKSNGGGAARRTYRMAYLGASSAEDSLHLQDALFGALRDLGYVEGDNLVVERRYSEGDHDQLDAIAHELAKLHFDLVYVLGTSATVAASRAITEVPIVFASVAYPVAMGLVRSLWEPGTHRTGVANPSDMLCRKRIQLVKEVFPKTKQVAVLHNPRNAVESLMLAAIEEACARHRMRVLLLEAKSGQDIPITFEALRDMHADMLYVIESPLSFMHRAQIVEHVARERLAAMYGFSEFADAGGLMSYSFNLAELVRASAVYVHKIFSGEKASALPIEVPAKLELVINLKTARALGLSIPPSILKRADRVIE